VKYIKKGKEPSSFTAWKKEQQLKNHTPNWKGFQQSVKNDVFDALLREQGYICCYCGSRITRNKCHIEHLKPKGIDTYKHLMFEYTNLLASCQGESEAPPPVPVHCGHKKGAWYDEHLMISPLEANCADFFIYTEDGQILETDALDKKAAAATTIKMLCLNIPKLTAMREEVIKNLLADIDIDELTDEEKQKLVQGFEQPDANGQYQEFCGAIAYILNQYFIA
jgi:uncharacterized protein (TIGR02646 family)